MERLTIRSKNSDMVWFKDAENGNAHLEPCEMTAHHNRMTLDKLAAYEDDEEQCLILRLPCGIGSDVYIIPSKINYELNILSLHPENNKVYHQKVALITFTEKGWYMECDKDREYATDRILSEKMYKETWFLSQEEAEAKLKEMEGSHAENRSV